MTPRFIVHGGRNNWRTARPYRPTTLAPERRASDAFLRFGAVLAMLGMVALFLLMGSN